MSITPVIGQIKRNCSIVTTPLFFFHLEYQNPDLIINRKQVRIIKIISGGQTGVDRSALDAAIELGIKHGGFCPKGRRSEDGIIPSKYIMSETETDDYSERTLRNVQFSDGTLILHKGKIIGGTALTEKFCFLEKKTVLTVNILDEFAVIRLNFNTWVKKNTISILNIAGPRESEAHLYKKVKKTLMELLSDHIL